MKNLRTGTAKFDTIRAKSANGLYLQDEGNNGMLIKNGGNVGIGTTNPNRKLQVHSNIAVSQTIAVTTLLNDIAITHASIGHGADKIGKLQLGNASGNNKVFLTSSGDSYLTGGKVGIGTTNPDAKLHIEDGFLQLSRTTETNNLIRFQEVNTTSFNIGTDVRDDCFFIAGSSFTNDRFFAVQSDGKVGIGTMSPDEALHIKGDDKRMFIGSDDYNLFSLGRRSSTELDTAYLGMMDEGDQKVVLDTSGDSFFTGGNVGIGTQNPSALFDVVPKNNELADETVTNASFFRIYDNATSGTAQGRNGGVVSIDANYYLASSDIFTVKARGENKFTIKGDGKVGIGTTSPSAMLDVQTSGGSAGSINQHIKLTRGTTSGAYFSTIRDSAGNDVSGLVLGVNTTNALTIKDGGNVGIGTTNPSTNRLQVMAGENTQPLFVGSTNGSTCTMNRDSSDGRILRFEKNGLEVGYISTNSNSLPSDRNFKRNVSDLELGLDFVNKLKPSVYNYKIDDEDCPVHYGLIAQDVESALEECGVEKNSSLMLQHSPTEKEEESDYSLDYGKLVPVLTKAIQEQQQLIDDLKSQNESLAARISALES